MSVLVIAEHDNAELKPATLNTVTAAKTLGDVTVLVAGSGCAISSAESLGLGVAFAASSLPKSIKSLSRGFGLVSRGFMFTPIRLFDSRHP